jgi:uncharacterized phage-associated protein
MRSRIITPFDKEKAVEAIKYVALHAPRPDIYWIGKIIYAADKKHLERFGRLLFGDDYVAMAHGPVPSGTYDLLKAARYAVERPDFHPALGEFEIHGKNRVVALKAPDRDCFSESDIQCLDEAIAELGHLSFGELKERSHDQAFRSADENDFIDLEQIVAMMPNGAALLEHLRESSHV